MISLFQRTDISVPSHESNPRRKILVSLVVISQFLLCFQTSFAFQKSHVILRPLPVTRFFAAISADDEITKQLERAKALLAKSKAKIEAKEMGSLYRSEDKIQEKSSPKSNIPFFASQIVTKTNGNKREKVVKATNGDGLVTIDGDLMAQLSEAEEWEIRSLLDVFENETKNLSDPFSERDVAASIYGLQKVLQTEDFHRIFDKRNRFIGEQ